MRFHVTHPTDPQVTADYGWDHAIGFFVVIRRGRRIIEDYDCLANGYEHLNGVLNALIRNDFFDICDVVEAMLGLQHAAPEDLDPGLRFVGEIISNLRSAADQE